MRKASYLALVCFLVGTWVGYVGGHFTENKRLEKLDSKVEEVIVDSVRYRRYSEDFRILDSRMKSLELRALQLENAYIRGVNK